MSRKLVEIASEIVQNQVSQTHMAADVIGSALRQVFGTLSELQREESGEVHLHQTQETEPAKALKPEDSIQNDKIICLECGAEMRQLTKGHLASHYITAREYKKRYGFTMRTSLAAESLTKAEDRSNSQLAAWGMEHNCLTQR